MPRNKDQIRDEALKEAFGDNYKDLNLDDSVYYFFDGIASAIYEKQQEIESIILELQEEVGAPRKK